MEYETEIDILCFGAHPDDVEIGMGGTVAKCVHQGYKLGIIDLTAGERSSNGNKEIRNTEALKASHLLGVQFRRVVGMKDRGLYKNEENILQLVEIIRQYKPKIVFSPFGQDRHPDHGACTELVKEAVFSSGIKKYFEDCSYGAFKVQKHYTYMINGFHKPDFYINISPFEGMKIAALQQYKSQFGMSETGVNTPLTDGYIESIEARDRLFGKECGCAYAEGFFANHPLMLDENWLGV